MSTTSPDVLLAQAKCYLCLGVTLAEAIQIALLVNIANNSSGGSPIAFSAPVVKANAFGNYVNDTGHAALLYVVFHQTPGAGNEAVCGVTTNGQTYMTGSAADADTLESHLPLFVPLSAGDAYSIIQISGDPLTSTVGDPGQFPLEHGHILIPFAN